MLRAAATTASAVSRSVSSDGVIASLPEGVLTTLDPVVVGQQCLRRPALKLGVSAKSIAPLIGQSPGGGCTLAQVSPWSAPSQQSAAEFRHGARWSRPACCRRSTHRARNSATVAADRRRFGDRLQLRRFVAHSIW